jgi:hypothetical protein
MTANHADIDAAIQRYQAARLGPSGESTDKVVAVHDLESHLAHPAAEAFLVSVLRDRDEYDLARVEVCKALRTSPPGLLGRGYADALAVVLRSGDDILVRQWAAQALQAFRHIAEVAYALAERLADSSEDPDVRHNALASLRGAAIGKAERALLERALSDSDVGAAVAALLRGSSQ